MCHSDRRDVPLLRQLRLLCQRKYVPQDTLLNVSQSARGDDRAFWLLFDAGCIDFHNRAGVPCAYLTFVGKVFCQTHGIK